MTVGVSTVSDKKPKSGHTVTILCRTLKTDIADTGEVRTHKGRRAERSSARRWLITQIVSSRKMLQCR